MYKGKYLKDDCTQFIQYFLLHSRFPASETLHSRFLASETLHSRFPASETLHSRFPASEKFWRPYNLILRGSYCYNLRNKN